MNDDYGIISSDHKSPYRLPYYSTNVNGNLNSVGTWSNDGLIFHNSVPHKNIYIVSNEINLGSIARYVIIFLGSIQI